jgi:hypothetical protein
MALPVQHVLKMVRMRVRVMVIVTVGIIVRVRVIVRDVVRFMVSLFWALISTDTIIIFRYNTSIFTIVNDFRSWIRFKSF